MTSVSFVIKSRAPRASAGGRGSSPPRGRGVYEPALGLKIDRQRVYLYNAAVAISYLAYRAGTAPEADSCGRTLVEDLRWTAYAIDRYLSH